MLASIAVTSNDLEKIILSVYRLSTVSLNGSCYLRFENSWHIAYIHTGVSKSINYVPTTYRVRQKVLFENIA